LRAHKPNIVRDSTNAQQEVELELPDINKSLLIAAFTGVVTYNSNYSSSFNAYIENPAAAAFHKLQHDLLDVYPAILNVQIRDLFTSEGKRKGRFRLRQLGEVYRTLTQLLSAVALADLWDIAMEEDRQGVFKISTKQRKAIKQYTHSETREEGTIDHFQLLRSICSIFVKNNAPLYMTELLNLDKKLRSATKTYKAYQFFEVDFCPRFQKENILDKEVVALCQTAEEQLGLLLQATAFLANYEIIRVKDISVNYPSRRGVPAFVHQKAHISGREYPTIDHEPISYNNTINNHSVFLTRNAKADGQALNLSPFVIDQNAFKGKKHYLPKVYFFEGIDKEGQVHYNHVDTQSLNFILTNESTLAKHAYLKQLPNSIRAFCQDIGG
jgi:hypothetical protein